MLLDEWSSKELELSRAIGGSRASGARNGEGLLDCVADDPLPSRLAGPGGRGGFGGNTLADTLDDTEEADMRLDSLDRLDAIDLPRGAYAQACHPAGRQWGRDDAATRGTGDTRLALDHVVCGGDGVVLSLLVSQQPARVWVDAETWCDWLRASCR